MYQLKNCPFCSAPAELRSIDRGVTARCTNFGWCGALIFCHSVPAAIAAWNRRVSEEEEHGTDNA